MTAKNNLINSALYVNSVAVWIAMMVTIQSIKNVITAVRDVFLALIIIHVLAVVQVIINKLMKLALIVAKNSQIVCSVPNQLALYVFMAIGLRKINALIAHNLIKNAQFAIQQMVAKIVSMGTHGSTNNAIIAEQMSHNTA